eukprot:s124_g17.t1
MKRTFNFRCGDLSSRRFVWAPTCTDYQDRCNAVAAEQGAMAGEPREGCETCFAREFYNYDDSVPYQTDHDIAFIVLTLA